MTWRAILNANAKFCSCQTQLFRRLAAQTEIFADRDTKDFLQGLNEFNLAPDLAGFTGCFRSRNQQPLLVTNRIFSRVIDDFVLGNPGNPCDGICRLSEGRFRK